MKKNTLLLWMLITFSIHSFAQLQNPDLDINNGNDDPNSPINCPTFLAGSISTGPGSLSSWYRSHGTAEIVNGCEVVNGAVRLNGQFRALGQGIVQEYKFKAGKTYRICYKLIDWDIPNAQFGVILAENLQQILPPTSCVVLKPGPSIGNLQDEWLDLPFSSKNDNPCVTTFEHTEVFTAKQDFNYLYVYFQAVGDNSNLNFIVLDKIDVAIECQANADQYFDDVTNNPLAGYHDRYEHIYAGSSYNGGSSTPVAVDPGGQTIFEAKYHIEFKSNFVASVNYGASFLAIVNYFTCSNNCPPPKGGDSDGDDGEGKPGKTGDNYSKGSTDIEALHVLSDNIHIYPNPTTGVFNIETPQYGNYTIRIMNMLGSTVYEGKMVDEQKTSIQLDSSLPPGNYTLHISGDGLRHVERITLTK